MPLETKEIKCVMPFTTKIQYRMHLQLNASDSNKLINGTFINYCKFWCNEMQSVVSARSEVNDDNTKSRDK